MTDAAGISTPEIMMNLHRTWAANTLAGLAMFGLSACQAAKTDAPQNAASSASPEASEVTSAPASLSASSSSLSALSLSPSAGPISCAAEIGKAAAEKRAHICRSVSPATHPPCNAANSCAMIDNEIARSCALFADKAPADCQPAPKSQAAAVAVVKRYYAALNARDYATAWQQWGDNGPPNQSLSKFAAGFAHTRSTQVTIGQLEPAEGGAGSIYQTVPVTVEATLDNGQSQRFTGDYIVRRVNGVDGATPAQLRWHIDMAHLKAAPTG
ncbi:hypothetical protein [Asticcacaulis sp. EMRT-3]|uniref:hypothetical protein n=1 Tax=Asticcacaulis sp. EMRT-3 TaxID=3040349 RepID=UPI0024AEC9B0|nr:hypothetical protein [Asticcacaulis sp. EMRT-3]MDI7775110.1 hypothetical protein [Asticcacaulis sp. EMRT-3]